MERSELRHSRRNWTFTPRQSVAKPVSERKELFRNATEPPFKAFTLLIHLFITSAL